ncbi:hypothetical protein D3C73_847230 [compost metagenome]
MNPVVDAVINIETFTALVQVAAQAVVDSIGVDIGQLRMGQTFKGLQVTLAHG